jgi:hypothetical protein
MKAKLRICFAIGLAAVALGACGGVKRAGRAVGRVFGVNTKTDAWVASVHPEGAQTLRGNVIWGPGASGGSRATVNLSGGEPLRQHPWHLHKGRCGDNGEIVGPASAYPILIVDTDGSVKLVADLPFTVTPTGDFYVNVHASETAMSTILACGNMIPRTNPDTTKQAPAKK